MFGWLLIAFTVVPLVELYLLLFVGRAMGVLPTVALVLVTGVVGAALARREGFRVLRSWQDALRRGETPAEGVVSGVLILVAGVLLVTPGILTDVVGFLLLLPPSRRLVAARLAAGFERRIADGRITVVRIDDPRGPTGGAGSPGGAADPRVIDVTGKAVSPRRPAVPADSDRPAGDQR